MNPLFYITKDQSDILPEQIPIVFLHGFTGSANEWLKFFSSIPAKFFAVTIDLPGHGKSVLPQPEEYSQENMIRLLLDLFQSLHFTKLLIVGYSMGGRAALSFVNQYPDMVRGLFLESATAGIENAEEQKERVKKDNELADFIFENGLGKFTDYWTNLPLFDSQKSLSFEKQNDIRKAKLKNDLDGLAYSLRGFSSGSMTQLWDKIPAFNFPVHLLTGELDEKFTAINSHMNDLLPDSEHTIINNCGHNVHLENPEAFIDVLLLYLNKFIV